MRTDLEFNIWCAHCHKPVERIELNNVQTPLQNLLVACVVCHKDVEIIPDIQAGELIWAFMKDRTIKFVKQLKI